MMMASSLMFELRREIDALEAEWTRRVAEVDRRGVFELGTVTLYAARAGLDVTAPEPCPPSFRHGIAGDWERAAAAWVEIGDPYERAIELVLSGQGDPALEGLRTLDDLGAVRTAAWARKQLRVDGVALDTCGP